MAIDCLRHPRSVPHIVLLNQVMTANRTITSHHQLQAQNPKRTNKQTNRQATKQVNQTKNEKNTALHFCAEPSWRVPLVDHPSSRAALRATGVQYLGLSAKDMIRDVFINYKSINIYKLKISFFFFLSFFLSSFVLLLFAFLLFTMFAPCLLVASMLNISSPFLLPSGPLRLNVLLFNAGVECRSYLRSFGCFFAHFKSFVGCGKKKNTLGLPKRTFPKAFQCPQGLSLVTGDSQSAQPSSALLLGHWLIHPAEAQIIVAWEVHTHPRTSVVWFFKISRKVKTKVWVPVSSWHLQDSDDSRASCLSFQKKNRFPKRFNDFYSAPARQPAAAQGLSLLSELQLVERPKEVSASSFLKTHFVACGGTEEYFDPLFWENVDSKASLTTRYIQIINYIQMACGKYNSYLSNRFQVNVRRAWAVKPLSPPLPHWHLALMRWVEQSNPRRACT